MAARPGRGAKKRQGQTRSGGGLPRRYQHEVHRRSRQPWVALQDSGAGTSKRTAGDGRRGLIHRGAQTGNGISYQNTSVRLARLGVTEKTEGLVRRKTAVLSAVRLLETTDPTAHAIEQFHKAIEGRGKDVVVQPQMVAVQGRKAKRHRRTRRPATACTPEPFPGSTAEVSSR